jgi:hypothetical protein
MRSFAANMDTQDKAEQEKEAQAQETAAWWKNQRTNFNYVAMAAGILAYLGFVSIWETFYGTHDKTDSPLMVLGGILLLMLRHLVIWIPFMALELWAFRFLPQIDQRLNPRNDRDIRLRILIIACVAACFLPMLLPAILVWTHG